VVLRAKRGNPVISLENGYKTEGAQCIAKVDIRPTDEVRKKGLRVRLKVNAQHSSSDASSTALFGYVYPG